MNPIQQITKSIQKTARRILLAIAAKDDSTDWAYTRSTYPRDRLPANRDEMLDDALALWRDNALARRIVELTTQYVVGGGIGIESKHPETDAFLKRWWKHNNMLHRTYEMCDELSRSGELYIAIFTDFSGLTSIRCLPPRNIYNIITDPNDLETELTIWERPDYTNPTADPNGTPWPAWRKTSDAPDEYGRWTPTLLHVAVNKPIGAIYGESDLAPIVKWLHRYSAWLEDRVRLNRFRNAFLFVVKGKFANSDERKKREDQLNLNPPTPGSVLVEDQNEDWRTVSPNLDSFEAASDGLAIKKIIAAGTGTPLHFLAEPESATRTTAEASGGPTYRRYEQRQKIFVAIIAKLAEIARRRRAAVDSRIVVREEITIRASDISGRDNIAMANAASTAISAFGELRNRNLIDDHELLRIAYKFSGENDADLTNLLARGKIAPKIQTQKASPQLPKHSDDPNETEE